MDWIEDNKFLAGWIAVTVIGCVLLGMNLLKARGAYQEAYDSFVVARDQVRSLEGKPLYPSQENVEKKAAAVAVYRDAVHDLHSELAALQRPLRNVEQTELAAKLKNRIKEINRDARRLGVGLPDGFSFGMPQYVNKLPPAEQCSLLDYQLDSISSLCSVLLSKGISSIESLERHEVREKKSADKSDRKKAQENKREPVVRRYPVKIVFKTKPDGLREFLNVVSNPAPGAPYHIVRMIRIANQKQAGPLRGSTRRGGQDFGGERREAEDGVVEIDVPDAGTVESDFSGEAGDSIAGDISAEEGEPELVEDAEFVLGREQVEVFAEIELLRFAPPREESSEESGSGRQGAGAQRS